VAVLIPCRDEAGSVATVIDDARRHLPGATIYVYDNDSSDRTSEIARAHGARVVHVPRHGKGHVVRAMLERATEDVLVLTDGDDTYDLAHVRRLVDPVARGECDMVVGARLGAPEPGAFRRFHVFGNNLVRWLINYLFDSNLTDILSGYRAFSRRVAKTIPMVSTGFEVETEWTIQMLIHGYDIREVTLPYAPRRDGSTSKLRTFRDGARILWTIFRLFKDVKPLTLFGTLALLCFLPALGIGAVVLGDYLADAYVHRVPLAVLATGLFITGMLCTALGVLMNSAAERQKQLLSVLKKLER
jgi:glycosyltransferase involved in cell wall biosynthesis